MRRREFIKSIGGWAIAWPLAADAQDANRIWRIGVLLTLTAEDPETKAGLAAFRQVLQRSGWDEGRGVQIEYRTAEGDAGRIRQYVAELVALAPDVIFAVGTANAGQLLQATVLYRLYSHMSPTRSERASSRALRDRAVMPLALFNSNTA